jgi:hypothetical protein
MPSTAGPLTPSATSISVGYVGRRGLVECPAESPDAQFLSVLLTSLGFPKNSSRLGMGVARALRRLLLGLVLLLISAFLRYAPMSLV